MWYTNYGKDGDVILSSRVRLARNLSDMPFPIKETVEQQKEIIEKFKEISKEIPNASFINLSDMSERDKQALSEQHLISPNMINNDILRGLILSDDGRLSIMVNEEDHLRIQAMREGFALEECRKAADAADDIIESRADYAFSEKLGYLTGCITNVGTGLRASVMAHLPALSASGRMGELSRNLSKMGVAVRGLFGEGSEALGNIYQISNQITLGISEDETISRLSEIVTEIIAQERTLEAKIYDADKFRVEDRVCRALGLLKSARIITSNEALSLLSDVRFGINLGIIKGVQKDMPNKILYSVLPGTIAKNFNIESVSERDIKRAEIIREMLS